MNIAKFCIRHKVTTLLAVIMIAVFGVVYTTQLQMALLPNIEYPAAYVYCYYNGAGPEDIEQLVTRPLESAIMSVPGVDSVTSSSADSISTIQIMYVENTDVDIAATKLREKFDALSLPEGCGSPVILNINVSELMPSAIVGLLGDDLAALQQQAENVVAPTLERIDGVASVSVSGGVERQITVTLDAQRAAGYGLSTSYITQILQAENLLYPAGEVYNGSQKLSVTTDAQLSTVDEVANINIPLQTGGTVRLGEVADVAFETSNRDAIAAMDGTPGIILQVSKRSGANEVKTAEAVVAAMEELAAKDGSIHYAIPYVASEYINVAVDAALEGIILGVVLAALVVWLFLRRGGATMTIAVSMPVCILAVFVLMYVCDLTLNMMSLGGIAMGVGMIVDNSIIVLENIYRWASEGHDRMTSCVEGTKEVTLSLTASTLTTVAVFLPLGLTGGIAGQIFKDFCLTIAFLILGSLAVAVTLVPLLCYFLLGGTKQQSIKPQGSGATPITEKPLSRAYRSSLNFLITHRWAGVALTVVICIVSVLSVSQAGMELIPEMDEGQVSVTVSMPNGSTMEDTAAIEDRIAAIAVDTIPELEQVYYSTGSSTSIMSSSSGASVTISLVDLDQRDRSSADIAKQLRHDLQDIAGCELTVSTSSTMSMSTDSDISVELTGDDYDQLAETADDLANQISALPDAINVESSAGEQTPRVAVKINRENASRFGLNAATIGGLVRGELTGSTATTLRMNGEEYDVTVAGDEDVATSLDALRSMQIPTMTGGTVPLSMVADVYTELSPQSVVRKNQKETVTITGESESGDSNAIKAAVDDVVAKYELPDGVEVGEGDTAASQIAETTGTLMMALAVAIMLVYFILATQFNSFSLPVAIMLILPIGLLGSMIMLWPTGNHVSMVALLGVIILAGTVVNSSIVLIDYTLQRRQRGEDKNTAILNACPRRVRPVLMTAMTTILGLVPMVCSSGEGSEMMKPMGVVMMTGMVISTIATLFITPVYYSLTDSVAARLSGLFKKIKLPKFNFHKKNPQQ